MEQSSKPQKAVIKAFGWLQPGPALRAAALAAISMGLLAGPAAAAGPDDRGDDALDRSLETTLRKLGFTGKIESTLTNRLGRPLDLALAEVGRRLFFDPINGIHNDNSCAGCHAPNAAFGDTQSIAIGIQNNLVVGTGRKGPRNQRRSPSVLNTAFFPQLMWNARFGSPSGSPFDNSRGFAFPAPEGTQAFAPNDPLVRHLLIAHAHLPATELNEAAGFTGTKGSISPRFDQFDDGLGGVVPGPDQSGFRNEPIRQEVIRRLNATKGYVDLFGTAFPEVRQGVPISMLMYARAIAEFEFTLVRATAPIDQFARGQRDALSSPEKRGAVLFFGKANCVSCHAVTGNANEMFSDFKNHNAGVPQIAPRFGLGFGNTIFDGPGEDEDFGLEQVSGNPDDRYKFRTSPLRNVGLQSTFFHNGAFTRLDDAIRYHLDALGSAARYSPRTAGVATDIYRRGPMEASLQRIDPLLASPVRLSETEIQDLNRFVRIGLTDTRARNEDFCKQIPPTLPSNMRPMTFQGCTKN
jgi:cytochrome c peroxidase